MQTIERQTRAAYGCLVTSQSPVAAGLAYGLSVTQQRRCSCSCRLRCYMSVMPLPFYLDPILW